MAREAELILEALDRHLAQPGTIRLLGGAALILGYGLDRTTEDVDLLQDDAEVRALIETSDFGEALDATNLELEPASSGLAPGDRDDQREAPSRKPQAPGASIL